MNSEEGFGPNYVTSQSEISQPFGDTFKSGMLSKSDVAPPSELMSSQSPSAPPPEERSNYPTPTAVNRPRAAATIGATTRPPGLLIQESQSSEATAFKNRADPPFPPSEHNNNAEEAPAQDLEEVRQQFVPIDEKQHFVMIDPRNRLRLAWDVLILFLDIICYFATPIALIWDDRVSFFRAAPAYLDPYGLTVDIIFVIDILLHFFTYSLDASVSFQQHRLKYCRFWLWVHLLSCIPGLFFPAARLLRVFDLFRLWQNFRFLLQSSGNVFLYLFARLAAAIFLFCIALHLFGCFWMTMGLNERGSWVDAFNVQLRQLDIVDQMSYAYYFVGTLFSTVGLSEITPQSVEEHWFALFSSVCGVLLVAYLVAVATSILFALGNDTFNPPEFRFKQELIAWLSRFGGVISPDDGEEILWYFRRPGEGFKYLRDQRNAPLQHRFFSHLPPSLRLRLAVAIYGDFVDHFEAFLEASGATDGFVEDLLKNLQQRYYRVPHGWQEPSIVISLGEQVREVIFLTEGVALITGENAGQTKKGLQVEKGFWFGGHQCTEEHHPSPIQLEALDALQPIVVHYMDMWAWRDLLARHPRVASNIIDLSKKQSTAILRSLKVPRPERYLFGQCLLNFPGAIATAAAAAMPLVNPSLVGRGGYPAIGGGTHMRGKGGGDEAGGGEKGAAIPYGFPGGPGRDMKKGVVTEGAAASVQPSGHYGSGFGSGWQGSDFPHINGLLLPYHLAAGNKSKDSEEFSGDASQGARSMWGRFTLDSQQGPQDVVATPMQGDRKFAEDSQKFNRTAISALHEKRLSEHPSTFPLVDPFAGTQPSIIAVKKNGELNISAATNQTGLTENINADTGDPEIPFMSANEGPVRQGGIAAAPCHNEWVAANKARRFQQAYARAAHRGFCDAEYNTAVNEEYHRLSPAGGESISNGARRLQLQKSLSSQLNATCDGNALRRVNSRAFNRQSSKENKLTSPKNGLGDVDVSAAVVQYMALRRRKPPASPNGRTPRAGVGDPISIEDCEEFKSQDIYSAVTPGEYHLHATPPVIPLQILLAHPASQLQHEPVFGSPPPSKGRGMYGGTENKTPSRKSRNPDSPTHSDILEAEKSLPQLLEGLACKPATSG